MINRHSRQLAQAAAGKLLCSRVTGQLAAGSSCQTHSPIYPGLWRCLSQASKKISAIVSWRAACPFVQFYTYSPKTRPFPSLRPASFPPSLCYPLAMNIARISNSSPPPLPCTPGRYPRIICLLSLPPVSIDPSPELNSPATRTKHSLAHLFNRYTCPAPSVCAPPRRIFPGAKGAEAPVRGESISHDPPLIPRSAPPSPSGGCSKPVHRINLRRPGPGGGMAYAGDLKSPDAHASCGFDPHPGHTQITR